MRALLLCLALALGQCSSFPTTKSVDMHDQYTNALINETSPYLQQHAHNPVDWLPWGDEALEKARSENKLILVSIGYAACHWCHVMEHESFEDTIVAALMNEHFVSIKIDREERPDVDQIYMTAVHLMGQRGGWPLNVICTPEGKPVYGGTYFPKSKWMKVLEDLNGIWEKEPQKMKDYSNELTTALQSAETLIPPSDDHVNVQSLLEKGLQNLLQSTDPQFGGLSRAPKFPVPVHLDMMLQLGIIHNNTPALKYVETTLEQMAIGGIYDQIGGGFARYSTDEIWKVPHFEKMLYDNAQLIGLYSDAFKHNQNPLMLEIAQQTLDFCLRELRGESGLFYCSLDADSEGEEGKFYVWKPEELKTVLNEKEFDLFQKTYQTDQDRPRNAFWEHGNWILMRRNPEAFNSDQIALNSALLQAREHRVRPALDDKKLISWNGLMLNGICKLFQAQPTETRKNLAVELGDTLWSLFATNGFLPHMEVPSYNENTGLLEDYVHVIDAFFELFQITQNAEWLNRGTRLMEYVGRHFGVNHAPFYTTRSTLQEKLLSESIDRADNVIPAGNSTLALQLFRYGRVLGNTEFVARSREMLLPQIPEFETNMYSYSNWAILAAYDLEGVGDVVVDGKEVNAALIDCMRKYAPGVSWIDSRLDLGICSGKNLNSEINTYYYCLFGSCELPTQDVNEVYQKTRITKE